MQKRFWRIGAVAAAGFVALSMVVPASHAVGVEVEQEQGPGHIEKSSKFQIIPSCEDGNTKLGFTETEKKYRIKLDLKVKLTGEVSKPHFSAPFLKVRVNDSYNCTWQPANSIINNITVKDAEGNPKVTLGSTQRFNCDGNLDITKDSQAWNPVELEILGRELHNRSWQHIATTTPRLANLVPLYQVRVDGKVFGEASDSDHISTIPSTSLKPGTEISLEAKGPNDTVAVASKTLTSDEVCPPSTPKPDEEKDKKGKETPTPTPNPTENSTPKPVPTNSTTPTPNPEPSRNEETPKPEDTPTSGDSEGGSTPSSGGFTPSSGGYIPSSGNSETPQVPTPPVAGVSTPAPVSPLPPVAGVNESAPTTPQTPVAPVPPVAGVQENAPATPEALAKTGVQSGIVASLAAILILGGAALIRYRTNPAKHRA